MFPSKLKLVMIVFCGILLSGCAEMSNIGLEMVAPSLAAKKRMDAMIGMSEADLVRKWGMPSGSYRNGDLKIISYKSERTDIVISPFSPVSQHLSCETLFEISQGAIKSWSQKGNNCPTR